jgi:hypothetical protein
MLETFHATIKLITGEEVLAEVMPTDEHGMEFFVLSNPITIAENIQIDQEKGIAISGMIPKKWMNFANDDLTILNRQHIISMSEMDKFGVEFYNKALIAAKATSPIKKKVETKDNSGFIGMIESFRNKLEGTYNDSPNVPE